MNQCVLPASPLSCHSHWLGVEEKIRINFPLVPCTHQAHDSSQTPIKTIITGQRFSMDEAREVFLALTGYIGLHFTSLNILSEILP